MTRHRRWSTDAVLRIALASFATGVISGVGLVGLWRLDRTSRIDRTAPAQAPLERHGGLPPSADPSDRTSVIPPTDANPLADLRRRNLLVPVDGVTREKLVDSFRDARDKVREHEALDIPAPRGTSVLAVEDGTVEKLFTSDKGGLTVYQFDPSRTYAYYYAHLDGYAPGLTEHEAVRRGEVIGFVGTTGNAPPNVPHLHFAVFLLTAERVWWKGTALNPYDLWSGRR